MRKSERIRLLELEVTRLNVEMQYLVSMISTVIENAQLDIASELDSGKWYSRKPNRNE